MSRPGERAWKENTTTLDRVQSVVLALSEPRPAEYIADEAAVSIETARNHLDSLVELAVVLEHDTDNQPLYSPDPLYTRFQTIRSLLDSHNRDGLIETRNELQAQIDAWRDEYGVDSPDTLRDRAATSEAPQEPEARQTANEWELLEYRLNIVTDVIARYDTYTMIDEVE